MPGPRGRASWIPVSQSLRRCEPTLALQASVSKCAYFFFGFAFGSGFSACGSKPM